MGDEVTTAFQYDGSFWMVDSADAVFDTVTTWPSVRHGDDPRVATYRVGVVDVTGGPLFATRLRVDVDYSLQAAAATWFGDGQVMSGSDPGFTPRPIRMSARAVLDLPQGSVERYGQECVSVVGMMSVTAAASAAAAAVRRPDLVPQSLAWRARSDRAHCHDARPDR